MNLSEELDRLVYYNQLENACTLAEAELNKLPGTDFHKIIGKNLLHLVEPLLNYITGCYKKALGNTEVKAMYAEMNSFAINYDGWFINLFAYTNSGPVDDLGWLSDFQVSSDSSFAISGFEELQAVYKDYMENDKWRDEALDNASDICEFLIVLRLQQLFKEAKKSASAQKLDWASIPLFVGAHNFDMIYEARL